MAIKELKARIKNLKEELINEVLNDNTISKLEKLRVISDENLFPYASYIVSPFHDTKYYREYLEIVSQNPEYQKRYNHDRTGRSCHAEDYFHRREYDRHQTIDFADTLEWMDDDYDDDESDKKGIVIFRNSTTKDVCSITSEQFIDCIYNWCVKNKKIGFIFDW
jgi:hypothetical protein